MPDGQNRYWAGVGEVQLRGVAEQHLTMPVVTWEESLRDLEGRLAAQGGRGRRLSPRSRAAYLKDARRVAGWLADQGVAGPAAVTPSALEAAFRGLGWSPASRARAATALREWLAPLPPAGPLPGRPHRPAAGRAPAGAAAVAGATRRRWSTARGARGGRSRWPRPSPCATAR